MTEREKYQLFIAKMKVKPSPAHGLFYEMEFGVLHLWLYAESSGDAAKKATAIARELPYDLIEFPGPEGQRLARAHLAKDAIPPAAWEQRYEAAAANAKDTGIGVMIAIVGTGADPAAFLKMDDF